MKRTMILLTIATVASVSQAKVDLVTLPSRDTVQLTIYNSADMTLVRESRALTLKDGKNSLQFSWANTLIDPTSLEMLPKASADKIDVAELVYPPRVRNLSLWNIESGVSGKVPVEITYLTSGLSWRAFYMGTLTEDERTMRLQGYVRVTNNSGEDYENAQTRLIVGKVHILDQIAELARRQYPYSRPGEPAPVPAVTAPPVAARGRQVRRLAAAAALGLAEKPKEIKKEGLSEYFLYTIEGTETIPTGWSKRLLSFDVDEVPVVNLYKYEEERYGRSVVRFLSFKNDEEHNLGDTPIPGGMLKVYRTADDTGHLSYTGQSSFKYIPVDEDVELNLGPVANVVVEPKLMEFRTNNHRFDRKGNISGWDEIRQFKIEVRNTRDIRAKVEIKRNFPTQYWQLKKKGDVGDFEKIDLDTVKLALNLEPRSESRFQYVLTTHHGTRENPLSAWDPSPVHGSTRDIEGLVSLNWKPGDKASWHDVYLGTDREAVGSADTSDMAGIYQGRQRSGSYVPSRSLQWGRTYHWRIDEYNIDATISRGSVWSFTVPEYLVVDDLEGYGDDLSERIFETWLDGSGHDGRAGNGTGSTVGYREVPFAEQDIVHSGGQAMPFVYNNTGIGGKFYYSEAKRTWDVPKDWARHGVNSLGLWYRGFPGSVGSFSYDPVAGAYAVTGSGADIWDGADQFHYVCKRLSGDGEIIARVVEIGGPSSDEWRKVGVMIRESIDGDSLHAFMAVTPRSSHGLAFQYRDKSGNSHSEHGVDNATAPYWVKLVRRGDEFTGYHSPDGVIWTMKDSSGYEANAMNPVTIEMDPNVCIGLAVTSHQANVMCASVFSDVGTSGEVAGQWMSQDIPSNAAEPLYVALEDSAGHTKIVTHPDPNAAQLDKWQEWNIDLKEFSNAGVNLASVKKMYIGVGNPHNPQCGGTGKLYIDDIRLHPPRYVSSLLNPDGDFSSN
jgi:hypothetical protein